MKVNFKDPKTFAVLVLVVVAILGGVVFSLGNNDKQPAKAAQQTQQTSNKKEDNKSNTGTVADAATEAPATDTADASSEDSTVVSTASATKKTAVNTAVATTPAQTQQTQPTTPTNPETPVTPPEEEVPVEEEPTDLCEVNGRIVVPVGGSSCTYYLGTEDGQSVVWLPAAVDKPFAPVTVVIEDQVESVVAPGMASYVAFHFVAQADTPVGDYADPADTLTFGLGYQNGMPTEFLPSPVTVVAQ